MADADPDDDSATVDADPDEDTEIETVLGAKLEGTKHISVLMFSANWQVDAYGTATLTRSLINDLWLTDPEGHKIHITCAVLEEDGKISQTDLDDAKKHNVELRGAKRPRHDTDTPSIKWFGKEAIIYYRHLLLERSFDFIIGHMPYAASGTCNLQEVGQELGHSPKVILIVHALPRTPKGDLDSKILLGWLRDADIVFSVGHAVEAEIYPYIRNRGRAKSLLHKVYIPSYPPELLAVDPPKRKLQGKQVITLVAGQRKDLDATGLNYELAMAAAVRATDNILGQEGYDYKKQIRMELMVLAPNEEERDSWKNTFDKIKEKQPTKYQRITFTFNVLNNQSLEELKSFLEQTAVLLLPLKTNSSQFGVEVQMSAAACTPFLVSSNSGVASFLQDIEETKSVLHDTGTPVLDAQAWSLRIKDKLTNPDETKKETLSIRTKLIQDTTIASSHLDFLQVITEATSVQFTIEIDPGSHISDEGLSAAARFDVAIGNRDRLTADTFAVCFLTKLLCQREKIDLGLLDPQLPDSVKSAWQAVISTLEERDRKVVGIQSGSVTFIVFCPFERSHDQRLEETWQASLRTKLLDLLKQIGVKLTTLAVRSAEPKSSTVTTSRLLQRLQQIKTLVPDSGYDTVTSSYSFSRMSKILTAKKVEEWLTSKQGPPSSSDDQRLTIKKTWHLDHLPTVPTVDSGESSLVAFGVAESGRICVSSLFWTSDSQSHSLSLLQPITNTPAETLSLFPPTHACWNPIFIKNSGKEYLVACVSDNNIYMWDTQTPTSKTVFEIMSEGDVPPNVGLIDGDTVICAVQSPDYEFFRLNILEANTTHWNLKSTLSLNTGSEIIQDICYAKASDGTACLIVCCPDDKRVKAFEMVKGKIRWQLGKGEFGNDCHLMSICTDEDNMVYVADYWQDNIYVLSVEDGVIVNTIHLPYDILGPSFIRMHGDDMYILHLDSMDPSRRQISKVAIEKQ